MDPVSMAMRVPHHPGSAVFLLQSRDCARDRLLCQAGTWGIPVRPTIMGSVGPYAAGELEEVQQLPHESMIVVL
jgi:hypothetical protein